MFQISRLISRYYQLWCLCVFECVKVTQSCPTLWDPMDYTVHGILQARILGWVAISLCGGSSQPRDRTQVSRIAGVSFTSWATGKPKNTGVGSLSLLQRIFPTQESYPGLPHYRQVLYQLNHKGSHGAHAASLSPNNSARRSFIMQMRKTLS